MAYQSEIEKLEQRYRENPDQWFAALADSYRKAGSLDLALDVVRAGLEKRPNYVSGHIVLGRCLLQKPDDGAATGAFEKVLALDAENVIALKALSEIAERAGRVDDATRWLTRLLEVDPMNEEAEQALARLKEAPPPATAPAAGAGEAEESAGAGAPPAQGLESPLAEIPAVGEARTPAAETAPADDFVLEKSEEATVPDVALEPVELAGAAPALPVQPVEPVAPPAPEVPAPSAPAPGLETMEFEPAAGVGVPHAEGIENLAFEPPAPGEAPPAPDLEPMEFAAPPEGSVESGAAAGAPVGEPFDDQLAWGTGERLSGQISQQDLEAAEQAHEASLEPMVDMAGTDAPEGAGGGGGGGGDGESGGGSADLPLIFPDEPTPKADDLGREGEPAVGAEAAPVVTETMAELYVKQGLVAEAREIYRTLAAQRPKDAALAARLAALETTSVGGGPPRRITKRVLTAAETGGPSVRDFLSQVFGGAPAPPAPAAAVTPAAVPDAAEAPSGALEPVSMEAPGAADETAVESSGAPTRRASDEVSLAAVFGEEPAPAAPRAPGAGPGPGAGAGAEGAKAGGSFSFDEFFGGGAKQPDGTPTTRSAATRRDEDEDDFKRWLKGLKS